MTPTTNLPLQLNTTATAQPGAAPAAGEQAPVTDFLMMLAQLVGAPATKLSGPAISPGMNPLTVESPDDMPTDATDADELVAMFSLSLPVAPIAVQPIATSAATTDTSAVLELASDVLKGQSAALATAAELPAEVVDADPAAVDDSAVSFDSMLAPTTASEAQQAARTVTAAEAAISRTVHTPVGSAAWADEIGSRLTLMAENGKHTASLRLSPEHLGPLEIRIAISDDRASVWFGAAHADTRAAIETALPRLRELLGAQGLSLTDAGVFREPPRDQPTFTTPSSRSDGSGANGDDVSAVVASRIRLGLVDAYA